MNWLQMILAFTQIAPNIIATIGQVQQAIGKGNGPVKKAIVMNAVTHPSMPQPLVDKISSFVDSTAQSINDTHEAQAPANPPLTGQ